ncbi:MAG: hypothetical protein C0616_00785 [Desulfuromonas sp.]|nr:MAG: hypothetical protein C0616_00785 [Desulfuromonas sp.]
MKKLFASLWVVSVVTLLWVSPSLCASTTVNGVAFSKSVETKTEPLFLRGASLFRWSMIFDVYVGAIYLPSNIPTNQWVADIPKHLEICYLRDIPAEGFIESSEEHLRKVLSLNEYQGIEPRLGELFGLFRDVKEGDRYALTYQPGIGTTLSLNGEILGTISGHDFAVAYFGIWLGEQPLQKKFRDELLGATGS